MIGNEIGPFPGIYQAFETVSFRASALLLLLHSSLVPLPLVFNFPIIQSSLITLSFSFNF